MIQRELYFDHAASCPMRPEALEALHHWSTEVGNPSGSHRAARRARRAIDDARDQLSELCGFEPRGVIFTSGGTEADNLALHGLGKASRGTVVVSAVEHPAVIEPARQLGATLVDVDATGTVNLEAVRSTISHDCRMVSVMAVNNEIGSVQPIATVADLCREFDEDIVVHSDFVQGFSWLDPRTVGARVDAISLSAHKFGGPKGVGALLVSSRCAVRPQLLGGGQEAQRRSGTPNVAGIAAMAVAAQKASNERESEVIRVSRLRDRLIQRLLAACPSAALTLPGPPAAVSPHIVHVNFAGLSSEALLVLCDREGLCASAAASCASGAKANSHVLMAIGVDQSVLNGSLRLSLGYTTTESEIDQAVEVLAACVEKLVAV